MTQPASVPLSEMVQQSIKVLTKPSVQTFEEFENRGTVRDALIYVAIGALISGVLSLPAGLSYALASVISAVLTFFVSRTRCISLGRRRAVRAHWIKSRIAFHCSGFRCKSSWQSPRSF
jgi:hypothetical protein